VTWPARVTAGRAAAGDSWRVALVGAYVGVAGYRFATDGIPLEREQVLAWVLGLVIVVSIAQGHGPITLARAVRDWLILAVLFLAYDYSRGAADWFGMPLQVELPIVIDRAMFPGDIPTVELQERLGPFEGRRWWEAVVAVTYLTHFVVPYLITAVLWVRDRADWRAWLARFATTTAIGLAGYILVPTMPPWLASREGHLGPIDRMSTRGWRIIDLDIAERLLDKGQASVNLVAAFPSLHAAFPALVAAYFWARSGPLGRILLVAYPLLMAFTLVISGEHYMVDVLAGWAVVAVTMALWRRLDRRPAVQRWLAS